MRSCHPFVIVIVLALFVAQRAAVAGVVEAPGVRVEYDGITDAQAKSLAETLSAARVVYVEQYTFDMPQTVLLTVECGTGKPTGKPTRLHTDGNERVFLSLSSQQRLAPPMKSGTFNLYGMCHELGHVAMFRTLRQRPWLSGSAAEGWAHFTGSVVVDELYKTKGEALWFEPYDYRADGTTRLDRAMSSGSADDVSRAADSWRKLGAIIGRDGFPALFAAWDDVDVASSADPAPLLLDAMKATFPQHAEALADWWNEARPLLVEWATASPTRPQTIARDQLSNHPITLKRDDDAPDNKRSIGGGGHAILFDAPDANAWYLTGIQINGARYGPLKAHGTMFTVALCDTQMRPIQTWRKPYAAFERSGDETKWVRFDLPPTRVPQQFHICLDFQPSATNGVYVAIDASGKGHSRVARPGRLGSPLDKGEWMIRAELDSPKTATTAPADAAR
jgi:hypothetical protein